MASDPTWNFMDPASKARVLEVVRREMDEMLRLVGEPARWEAPTACTEWQVRDVIGHLVDTTEGYLPAFDIARTGGTAPEPRGVRGMAAMVDEGAKVFRKVPREELLSRLRDDMEKMMGVFGGLSDADWAGLMVPHPYMGPVPAMFYPEFQLVDYAVHGWDLREGIGRPHGLDGDAADLLVPLIFVLLSATADTSAVTSPYSVGIRVTGGANAGDTRAEVTSDGVQFAPGTVDDCAAVLEYDPASLVLVAYGRFNGGTLRGDRGVAADFRSLFFPI